MVAGNGSIYIGEVCKAKLSLTVTCDSHYCTCPGHLSSATQIGLFLLAKVSNDAKFRLCNHGLRA